MKSAGLGTRPVTGATWPGLVPQVTCGAIVGAVEHERLVVLRAGIGRQLPPAGDGLVELGALRRMRPAAEIVVRRLVGRDQAGPGAAFDRHVADRHAVFHREAADDLAGVLDAIADAAARA